MEYLTIRFPLLILSLSFLYQMSQVFIIHACAPSAHIHPELHWLKSHRQARLHKLLRYPLSSWGVAWGDILGQSFKCLLPSLLRSCICCGRISPAEKQHSPSPYISHHLWQEVWKTQSSRAFLLFSSSQIPYFLPFPLFLWPKQPFCNLSPVRQKDSIWGNIAKKLSVDSDRKIHYLQHCTDRKLGKKERPMTRFSCLMYLPLSIWALQA